MVDAASWFDGLQSAFGASLQNFNDYLPTLLSALAILLAGWIVAWLVRAVVSRAAEAFDVFLQGLGQRSSSPNLRLSPAINGLIANVIFWVVFLLFASLSVRVARLEIFTAWLNELTAYLPSLFAGGLIALVGYLLSKLVRDIVVTAAASADAKQSRFMGVAAQLAIMLTAVVIGLDQIGIDISFLSMLLGILVGALLLALAIAFGFGARDFVANLIGTRQVHQYLHEGEVVQFDNVEGQVLEVTPTSVVLLTEQGRVNVPAKLFQEQSTFIIAQDDDD